MNCRKVTNLVSAYIDGELTGAEMLAIRRHLSECAECAKEYESLRSLKQAMARLRTAVPRKDLAAVVIAKIEEQHSARSRKFGIWMSKLAGVKLSPVTAALAVFGAALVLLTAGDMKGFNADISGNQTALLPQVHQVSFLREISVPQIGFEFDKPLMVTSLPRATNSEVQLASFSR
ncbi:MAG: zf-HC2 domain-containing protein [Armatimonadota bacterium]|nr:zf-HC2 domain-containing protein [Armatimonadota bacterium]